MGNTLLLARAPWAELPRQTYANDRAPRGDLYPEKVKCGKDPLSMATGETGTRAPPALALAVALHVPNVPPSIPPQPPNVPALLMLLPSSVFWGEGVTSLALCYFLMLEIHVCSAPEGNLSSRIYMG